MNTPPRFADRLLEWFCAPHLLEEIQGDLYERYKRDLTVVGAAQANRNYIRNVLRFLRPFALKRQSASYSSPFLFSPDMLRNYLKIALRTFWRNKSFSAINILGLALGLTCSLLIYLWIRDELNVDRYHANGPHLYRIMWRQLSDGKRMAMSATPTLLAQELPKKFPEVVHAAAFTNSRLTFQVGTKVNKEQGAWAGADWFRMVSVPLLAGSPQTALSAPNSLAISRKLADYYFGSPQKAMGQSIRIDNQETYQVTAVFENLPQNTSQPYDFLLSIEDFLKRQSSWAKDWGSPSPETFIQLRPDADVAAFDAKIKHFLQPYLGITPKTRSHFDVELFLQPFEEMYLYSQTENGEISGGRIDYVHLLSLVAGFILLIACINFMNLSTARSSSRAKEVGVRKVVGAERSRLISQFIGEALLLTFVAIGIALAFVQLLLPNFNQLSGKLINIPWSDLDFWLALLAIGLVTGILAGSYPALFLSSLQPVRVLKGRILASAYQASWLKLRLGATFFRQSLVVVQFVISLGLITGTFVVYKQMQYIQTKNLGFDRENLIYVPLEGTLLSDYSTLKQELRRMPGIQEVARMDYQPSSIGSNTTWVDWPGKDPTNVIGFAQVSTGYDLDKVLHMKLMDGRYFSKDFPTDSTNYVINEEAARCIGYKNPIGQPLTFWGKTGKVIGVVQNFHFQSFHEPIKPIIMWFGENNTYGTLMVRTQPGQTQQALTSLTTICKAINPAFPFSFSFADQEYQNIYKSEQIVGILANYFAALAIFIACLGLFGLASFTAEQRTKEIGIRKVLGASLVSIVSLLSKDFLKLVVIALLIASPIAWYLIHQWLDSFVYKIDLAWWYFALTGLLAISIALFTVSFQSIKAALVNPVKSLRSE